MLNIHIFDLDNTLIYTNQLNSDSYNYALTKLGLVPIVSCSRVTRKVVLNHYPFLDKHQQAKLIQLKQAYFIKHINKAELNLHLHGVLHSHSSEFCVLWTSAEKERVLPLLEHYQLQCAFAEIIYSSKDNVRRDVEKICQRFSCTSEQLLFYEDNPVIIEVLRSLGQTVMPV